MKEIVDELFEEYKRESDPGEQALILYFFHARLAIGQQTKEGGSEEIEQPLAITWKSAAEDLDDLVERNPKRAFELGRTLSLLTSRNPEEEKIYRWMRAEGPFLLAKKDVRGYLIDYIEKDPEAPELVERLLEYMSFDVSGIRDKEAVWAEPRCYRAVTAMNLGIQLEGNDLPLADIITDIAKRRLAEKHVSQIVRYYHDSEETAQLAEGLEPFLAPLPESSL